MSDFSESLIDNKKLIMIKRPIDGDPKNEYQYLSEGDFMLAFQTKELAKMHLYSSGYTDEQIEKEGIEFEERIVPVDQIKKEAYLGTQETDKE
jgi:hypothetical protein